MKKKLTSVELAEAWKEGLLPLHTVVRRHFKSIGIWPVHEKVMLVLELIIGFANLGMWDTLVPVDDNAKMSVGAIVERYQLTEFLG